MYLRTWDNSVNANSQFQAFFHSPCLLVLRSTAAPIPTLQGAAPRASEDATWAGFLGGLKLAQPLPSPLERSVSFTHLVPQLSQGHGHILGASDQGRADHRAGHADDRRNEN